jgi:hypothetical protein
MKFNTVGTIYKNGRYRLVPHVVRLILQIDGRPLESFEVEEIEKAVSEVDRLAEAEGEFSHVRL